MNLDFNRARNVSAYLAPLSPNKGESKADTVKTASRIYNHPKLINLS